MKIHFHHFAYITKIVYGLFLISYFEYRQIWLNVLINDQHLNNITKLKKINTKQKKILFWGILCERTLFSSHPSIISLLISKYLNKPKFYLKFIFSLNFNIIYICLNIEFI